jgi:hypothetical protein
MKAKATSSKIAIDLKFLKSTEGCGPGPTEKEIEHILKLQKQVRTEARRKGCSHGARRVANDF